MPETTPIGNEVVRQALQEIYDEHGYLDRALVVEVAKDRRHVLHGQLTWNDKEAGYKHRLEEAGRLIRSVRVVFVTDRQVEEKIRSWQVVRAPEGNSYRPLEEIAEDPFARQLVQKDMERRWRQLYARYSVYSEFMDMVRRDLGLDGDAETG